MGIQGLLGGRCQERVVGGPSSVSGVSGECLREGWRGARNSTGEGVASRSWWSIGGGIESVYSRSPWVQEDGWHVMRRAFCEVSRRRGGVQRQAAHQA